MEKNCILEVFNVNVENINLEENVKKESVFYSPRQEGKEPYTALIRFLPIPIKEDGKIVKFEEKPYYMKKRYWLNDDSGNGTYYDSAVSINEKCPIQTTFFRLFNSEDIREKKRAKDFSLATHFYSLVYVLDDKQNPDSVGKVLIWRYTSDIKKLIEKELNPVVSEYQKKAKEKIAVWDLLKGKNLALVVGQRKVTLELPNGTKKERIFPDYDKSEFLESTPLEINGYELKANDSKSFELVTELLMSAPNEIADQKYKPWDEETKQTVDKILARYSKALDDNGDSFKENNTEVEDVEDDGNLGSSDDPDEILKRLKL
jgi:hypothetical protein